jgi:hypothetical protein
MQAVCSLKIEDLMEEVEEEKIHAARFAEHEAVAGEGWSVRANPPRPGFPMVA